MSMGLIKGITIQLFEKTQNGTDGFGSPIFVETSKDVANVLIRPISEEDEAESTDLTGKKVEYELCIPKGDTNEWANRKVGFFGDYFKTVGLPIEYIESMVPLDWNKKIKVVRFE